MEWQPIATVPRTGKPVILADFSATCLLSGAPHVWTARFHGDAMFECSYAATNENGEATHWMELPLSIPQEGRDALEAAAEAGRKLRERQHQPT